MKKVAILLTVYNRKDVTLNGLRSLTKQFPYNKDMSYDVYMTDDGSTDGTADSVRKEFPDINIISGDGSLFWSGGMRVAWQAAIDSGIVYDYYLWFNDDAMLFDDALQTINMAMERIGGIGIISGAFQDSQGNVSYGAWNRQMKVMQPNGELQSIFLLNGNLVLVSKLVVEKIGIIDKIFKHSLGDWDYGRRASKAGFKVMLTGKYVGVTNRHDAEDLRMYDSHYSIVKRWKYMHSPKYAPQASFIYNSRHDGVLIAIARWIMPYIYVFFPFVYKLRHVKS